MSHRGVRKDLTEETGELGLCSMRWKENVSRKWKQAMSVNYSQQFKGNQERPKKCIDKHLGGTDCRPLGQLPQPRSCGSHSTGDKMTMASKYNHVSIQPAVFFLK